MELHDHSIAWLIAGGTRAEERDRAHLRALADARSGVDRPGLVDRIRGRLDRRPVEAMAATCCPAPGAA